MASVTPVVVGRFVFSVLSLLMTTVVIYTCVTDGSPFRMSILTPWMAATLIDFYINVAILATWVFYKEDTWLAAIGWTIGFICLGSITSALYLAIEFFKLKASDPFYLVFLNKGHARSEGTSKKAITSQPYSFVRNTQMSNTVKFYNCVTWAECLHMEE